MGCFSTLRRTLDANHMHYEIISENIIKVYQKMKNAGDLVILISFKADNYPVFRCYDLGKFPKEKTMAALVACNDANSEYRWVKFYLDEDQCVTATVDAIVNERTVFDEAIKIIYRMLDIVDTVYHTFMKAKWA